MKKILLILCAALGFSTANAQLPSGVLAPNFTGTDLNGNTHELYSYLQQGYTVVIDVSATWCGPCWAYHNSHALENLWEQHGVDNGGNVIVLFIEGDPTTTNANLNGQGSNTQGNWVNGTPYPIIDSGEIADILQIGYFPTVYTVCPDGIITETGQLTASQHWNFINQNSCQSIASNDAGIFNYAGTVLTCDNADFVVDLANLGSQTLTAATITVDGVETPITYEWTGSLERLESTTVDLGSGVVTGPVTITVTEASDEDAANNTLANVVSLAADATTNIVVNIRFDNWPEEVGWQIRNESNTVVASRNAGYYSSTPDGSEVWESVFVPSTGCYSFRMTDAYGDGLHGGQYPGNTAGDGFVNVYSVENASNYGFIWQYNGSYNFAEASAAAKVVAVVGVEETTANMDLNIYPNPANTIANINFSLAQNSEVVIDVLNLVGEKVISVNKGNLSAGSYIHQLDVNHLSAGIYMVNVIANGEVSTMRVTVAK